MSKVWKGVVIGTVLGAVAAGVRARSTADEEDESAGERVNGSAGARAVAVVAGAGLLGGAVGWLLHRRDRKRARASRRSLSKTLAGVGLAAESLLPAIQKAAESARERAAKAADSARRDRRDQSVVVSV